MTVAIWHLDASLVEGQQIKKDEVERIFNGYSLFQGKPVWISARTFV